jgi:hypothetical protein
MKGLNNPLWVRLINLIHRFGNTTPIEDLRDIILGDRANDRQDAEIIAIRSNMTTVVRLLHDPSSQMMDMLFESLRNGKLCVVDISQMRGQSGLILSGIILQQIFEHNQKEFTEAEPNSIPTIAVLEEAQSVLGGNGGAESPYIAWVKEGRKFGLGAVLITQQPGSISDEILSQGDNWFIFHLLSSGDLQSVRKANSHFSNDLLSSLLNEPIPGNGIFWSSSGGKPYPISVRVLSFEELYKLRDPNYNQPSAKTYASQIKDRFENEVKRVVEEVGTSEDIADSTEIDEIFETSSKDVLQLYIAAAIKRVRENKNLLDKISKGEAVWMTLQSEIQKALPSNIEDKSQVAYDSVPKFMDEVYGKGKWKTVRKEMKSDPSKTTPYFQIIN